MCRIVTKTFGFFFIDFLISDDNMMVSLDQTTLTITQIRSTQFGKYTCIATNLVGTEAVSAWLNIYGKYGSSNTFITLM